ncbi:MAG: hypothetical protein RL591_995 [Planctomycetota bacterium]
MSAGSSYGRRCGGDLWRHPHQSEQVAKRSDTSAERSEAREDDVGRRATSRVASPLVMATPRGNARRSHLRLARRVYSHVTPLPPASQRGSATRNDRRGRHRSLRLRCAPPSASSSFIQHQSERERALQFRAVHTRASKLRSRLRALKLVALKTTRRVSLSTRGAFPCSVSCASRRMSPIPFLRSRASFHMRIIQGPPRNLTSRRPRT